MAEIEFGPFLTAVRGAYAAARDADRELTADLDVWLAALGRLGGARVPVDARDQPVCRHDGSGAKDGKKETCSTCGGVGQVRMQQGIFSVQQTCPACHGAGQRISDPCPACRGQGRIRETRTLSVKIPAGVDSGDRIRLAGEGEAGMAGAATGDLYVEVRVRLL